MTDPDKNDFWKTGKPMMLLALICFVAMLFMALYAHSLEEKYNEVVVKYNECNEGFYDVTNVNSYNTGPDFDELMKQLEDSIGGS